MNGNIGAGLLGVSLLLVAILNQNPEKTLETVANNEKNESRII